MPSPALRTIDDETFIKNVKTRYALKATNTNPAVLTTSPLFIGLTPIEREGRDNRQINALLQRTEGGQITAHGQKLRIDSAHRPDSFSDVRFTLTR